MLIKPVYFATVLSAHLKMGRVLFLPFITKNEPSQYFLLLEKSELAARNYLLLIAKTYSTKIISELWVRIKFAKLAKHNFLGITEEQAA